MHSCVCVSKASLFLFWQHYTYAYDIYHNWSTMITSSIFTAIWVNTFTLLFLTSVLMLDIQPVPHANSDSYVDQHLSCTALHVLNFSAYCPSTYFCPLWKRMLNWKLLSPWSLTSFHATYSTFCLIYEDMKGLIWSLFYTWCNWHCVSNFHDICLFTDQNSDWIYLTTCSL